MPASNPSSKHLVAGLYNRVAPQYGQVGVPFFAVLGRRLVELAHIGPDATGLDVGVGRGAVLFPAAAQAGHVIGIDIAERMLAVTAADLRQQRISNAQLLQMDGEQLGFTSETFDFVLCAFAIFFFSDLERALAEFRRVLRPGGRLGLSMTYRGDARWRWYNDLLLRYDREHHVLVNLGTDINRKPDQLQRAIQEAGFVNMQRIEEDTEFHYANAEEWWSSLWTHGARQPLERMEPEVLAAFKTEAVAQVRVLERPGGIPVQYAMTFLFGLKSEELVATV